MSFAVAVSTTSPRYITAMRSETCLTTARSWAMKISARFISRCRSSSRLMICDWMETSRAETASSQTMSLGLSAIARAMPMRWRWPPENSCGKRLAAAGLRPTRSSSSPAQRRRSWVVPIRWITKGSSRILPTVCRAFSDSNGSCRMIWMSRRSWRNSLRPMVVMSRPSKSTSPAVGSCRRSSVLPTVLLPQPDSPTRPTVSPTSKSNDTSSTACT